MDMDDDVETADAFPSPSTDRLLLLLLRLACLKRHQVKNEKDFQLLIVGGGPIGFPFPVSSS